MAFTRRAKETIVLMMIMGILINYGETMSTPALPVLVNFFNTDYDQLSWIITAYILMGTVSAAVFGRLADIYGKKRIFVILAGVYTLAISFGGFANTLGQFIAIRAVQGLGMGMFPVAYALLNDQVPKENLALAQGIISSTFTAGAAIGLVLGAFITQDFDWQWSYHSAIPVSFVLFIASIYIIKDYAPTRKESIDFAGIATLGGSVVLLILGLSEGQYWGWTFIRTLSAFFFSIASFLIFMLVEKRVSMPFISLKLLAVRNIFLANVTGLFAMAGMFFLFYTVPTMLQDPAPAGFGESIITSGLTVFPAALASMMFAPLAAKITTVKGPKVTVLIGAGVLFLSYLALLFNRQSAISILEDSTILGMSLSFVFVGIINILLVSTPSGDAGVSTGMNTVFRNIGTAIAPAIGGVIETTYTLPVMVGAVNQKIAGLPFIPIFRNFPYSLSFTYIYLVGMGFLVLTVIFALYMKNVTFDRNGEMNEH